MNFKTILMPKLILAKEICHKKATLILHSTLKCALALVTRLDIALQHLLD